MIFKKSTSIVSNPDVPDDYQLAQRAIAGEGDALQRLFSIPLRPTGYAPALAALKGMEHADCVQEFHIKLRNRLHKYNGSTPLHYWLNREFVSACWDLVKCCRSVIVHAADISDYLLPDITTPDAVLEVHQHRFTESQRNRLRYRYARDTHPLNDWRYLEE